MFCGVIVYFMKFIMKLGYIFNNLLIVFWLKDFFDFWYRNIFGVKKVDLYILFCIFMFKFFWIINIVLVKL